MTSSKRMLLFRRNPAFTLTATTTAPNQTVTIQRLTLSVTAIGGTSDVNQAADRLLRLIIR